MEIHGLSMLNCLITIGDEDPNDTLNILNKITVNEVVNLQIKDSYQTLINIQPRWSSRDRSRSNPL